MRRAADSSSNRNNREKPAFLMAVQRIVGGIEIERDLRRRRFVGIEKQIDEQRLDGISVVADLVIARWFDAAEFEAVQGAFARKRRAESLPASTASTGSVRKISWSFGSS